jgi:plastocyanin
MITPRKFAAATTISLAGLFGVAAVAAPGATAATTASAKPAVATARPAAVTPDTVKVNCGTRTDWWRVHLTDGATLCYADAGNATVDGTVDWIDTGNNTGYAAVDIGGIFVYYSMPDRYTTYNLGGLYVVAFHIN